MATTKPLLCAGGLLVCVLVVVNLQPAEAQGCGMFQASCDSITPAETETEAGLINAICTAKNADTTLSVLDLNNHLGNSNGVLVAENAGSFASSCKYITMVADQNSGRVSLQATCKNAGGTWIDTSIDLSTYIANDNGQLDWRDHC